MKACYILGVNCAYHKSSACLIRDGRIVAAVEEERFNRIKHAKFSLVSNPHDLPIESIRYCLRECDISPDEISHIGFSFNPVKRLRKNIKINEVVTPGDWGSEDGEQLFYDLLQTIPTKLSDLLGIDVSKRFHWIDHHLCHAASAFFVSPFEEAAVLSTDGIGEFTSTWMGYGKGNKMKRIKERGYPNSVGFLWTKMSRYLGFGEYGQGKVMGLGAYGDPCRFEKSMRRVVRYDNNGNYRVNKKLLEFRKDGHQAFEELFGKKREPDEALEERHADVAATLQKFTNDILLGLERQLFALTHSRNICRSGGVALNCLTNAFLYEHGPFEESYIQPAAHDAGTAVGACFYIWNQLLDGKREFIMSNPYLGPEYSDHEIVNAFKSKNISFETCEEPEKLTARLIADGNVIAWFQGRMEFGPRALGNRSILADPRRSSMPYILNSKVKHREYFRPFAPSVLEEKAAEWFDISKDSISNHFMLYACRVKKNKLGKIPAVTHVDGTSRIQCVTKKLNPRYYKMIREFYHLTSVPMVLNTSLNENEPIICSPLDAIDTCIRGGIEYLLIGNFLARVGCEQKHPINIYSTSGNHPDLRDILIEMEKNASFRQQLFNNEQCKVEHLNVIRQTFLKKILKKSRQELEKARTEFQFDPDTTKIKDYIISRR